ncbi:DegT/DnrJ/EryC1/StrS family aminotransferase [Mangrovimonas aestuarii]|uniref:DegT/DnrJ/EryC1/StrS family aminotransferase n=1 Tax=Mangrovimonas aestuarii TaxID=3018443 RepID=UPI002378E136|nr:DegT/DnrJ/EryC1/StrS family aminotransferase [Mangrovimonas aestuarii]
MINVTKTFLPPQEEYQSILQRAWATGWMTNRGILVKELEASLKTYLGVPNIIAMTNGTLPLQIAIKALGLSGEIITTPFSYVATTSSIVWEGCAPVFVDIHPGYLTIDETKIEAAITPKTSAILATHVFGNPCDVEAIQMIADRHGLKVIYDAAHCFGVEYQGKSLFNYGDVSTCSFHATKLFHTGEGGALVCQPEHFDTLYSHHNFGHDGPDVFRGLGMNAKMSELQAAMGLAVLPYMSEILEARARVVQHYREQLQGFPLQLLKLRPETHWNYSYFPIIFQSERLLLQVKAALETAAIYPRRYFYPSLDHLPYTTAGDCSISTRLSQCVLCLPLSMGLTSKQIGETVSIISAAL